MGKSINGKELQTFGKGYGKRNKKMTMDLYRHVADDTLFEAMQMMEKVV